MFFSCWQTWQRVQLLEPSLDSWDSYCSHTQIFLFSDLHFNIRYCHSWPILTNGYNNKWNGTSISNLSSAKGHMETHICKDRFSNCFFILVNHKEHKPVKLSRYENPKHSCFSRERQESSAAADKYHFLLQRFKRLEKRSRST